MADGGDVAQEVGRWHLVIVQRSWSDPPTLMDPLPSINMGDQDADHPREYEGDINAPTDKTKIDFDPSNRYACVNGNPQTNGCDFVDYVNLTQINDQKIHFHARNHGGRCAVQLLIRQRNEIRVTTQTAENSWVKGATFVVMVPADALDSTVVGNLGANQIFFTPTDPLAGQDAKRFQLLDKKVVDGVGTYFRFLLVDPFPT
jgi:hypothetical protein